MIESDTEFSPFEKIEAVKSDTLVPGYRKLASAVIRRAIKDTRCKKGSGSASRFLTQKRPGLSFWLQFLELDDDEVEAYAAELHAIGTSAAPANK